VSAVCEYNLGPVNCHRDYERPRELLSGRRGNGRVFVFIGVRNAPPASERHLFDMVLVDMVDGRAERAEGAVERVERSSTNMLLHLCVLASLDEDKEQHGRRRAASDRRKSEQVKHCVDLEHYLHCLLGGLQVQQGARECTRII
jgi:hypothetical protein